ncbi:Importin subunit beta-1 [Apiospora arundinis]|uniref:Importin subunit beta-1 n=1 Tax=Apiospora arundinis TaxID=335852 RepID=A0ABR2IS94_9PEZI
MLSVITTAEILNYVSAALCGLTILGMRNLDENVAKFAVEFWSTFCVEEINIEKDNDQVESWYQMPPLWVDIMHAMFLQQQSIAPAQFWRSRIPSMVTVETFSGQQCQTLEHEIAAALQAPHRSRFKSSLGVMKVCRRFAGEPGAGKVRC